MGKAKNEGEGAAQVGGAAQAEAGAAQPGANGGDLELTVPALQARIAQLEGDLETAVASEDQYVGDLEALQAQLAAKDQELTNAAAQIAELSGERDLALAQLKQAEVALGIGVAETEASDTETDEDNSDGTYRRPGQIHFPRCNDRVNERRVTSFHDAVITMLKDLSEMSGKTGPMTTVENHLPMVQRSLEDQKRKQVVGA